MVIGGATGGCAAALLLARAGARVTLIERIAHPRAVGAGIALAANGLAVLESIGLGPALRVARPVLGGRVIDGAGRTLLAPSRSMSPALVQAHMLRRSTLQGILLDAIAAEPLIDARFGTTLISARPDGVVTVRREDREATTGGETVGERYEKPYEKQNEEQLEADLIVAADGVHSRVRDGGSFGVQEMHTGLHYLRSLLPAGLGQQVEAWTAAGIFGSFEVDDGTYLYASCGTPLLRNAVQACDLDTLRATWRDAYPAAAPVLSAIDRWESLLLHEVVRVRCRRWWHDRIVLLGDAAHAMAPNLGQGANSALVDAAVLLDELRRAASLSDGLASYMRRRKSKVDAVARAAAALGQLAEWTHPAARIVRDRVVLPVAQTMTTPAAFMRVLQEEPETLRHIGRE